MKRNVLYLRLEPLSPVLPPTPSVSHPPAEESRLTALAELQIALCDVKVRDFLNQPDTQQHLSVRWGIEPIGGRIHPCQLDDCHYRELIAWFGVAEEEAV